MRRLASLFIIVIMLLSMTNAEITLETFRSADGTSFRYALLVPDGFDSSLTYPILLALPPGDQSLKMVEAGLGYWFGGEQLAWVIISPEAPNGQSFYNGSEKYIPELLDELKAKINFENDTVHLAGISNGGRSIFRLALDYTDYFSSILAVPGFPPEDSDLDLLARLKDYNIVMYAGENDSFWVEKMLETEQILKSIGAKVSATIEADQGHVMNTLNTEILFDILNRFR